MKVSIIIPTYNAADFLAEAVASALDQGEVVAEIIIVENNSTDGTLVVARSLAAAHPGMIRLVQETKQGCSAARNAGIHLARSEWLQFLDADDLLLPGKLAAQLQLIEPDTEWIIGGYRHQYADCSTEISVPSSDPWRGLVHDFAIGNTCANLYLKSTLVRLGGWPEDLPDNTDHQLHFQLLQAQAPYQLDPPQRMVYRHFGQARVSNRQPAARMERKVKFHIAVNDYLARHRPEYWSRQAPFFQATLIRALRMLATFNVATAAQYYRRQFPTGLPTLERKMLSGLVGWYPILGFGGTERIRLFAASVIPASWKRRLPL